MDVYILNSEFERVGVIDQYESLIWTERYQTAGDFELYFKVPQLPGLTLGSYLQISGSATTMIVERIVIETDAETGDHMLISGRSLESILDRRIVWGQSVFNGSLQTAIGSMLQSAFISPEISARAINGFTFQASSDPRITAITLDAQYTGKNIYSIIVELCEQYNIGFRIPVNDQRELVFQFYAGTDRSYDQTANAYVVFSPDFDNIITSEYTSTSENLRNVALVAGEGEGAARKKAQVGSGSGMQRRELFVDARDISSDTGSGTITDAEYIAQLEQRGLEKLAEYTMETQFNGEAEVNGLYKYGQDFNLGDIVQVSDAYGHTAAAYISAVITSHSANGISVYPTFTMLEGE